MQENIAIEFSRLKKIVERIDKDRQNNSTVTYTTCPPKLAVLVK